MQGRKTEEVNHKNVKDQNLSQQSIFKPKQEPAKTQISEEELIYTYSYFT